MKNVSDLRDILGETMRGVLDGKLTVEQARAIAQVGSVVCESAKVEIDMARATDGDYKGSGFIEVDPAIRLRQVRALK